MKLAVFGDYQVGVVAGDRLHDVTRCIDPRWQGTRYVMNHVVEEFNLTYREKFEEIARTTKATITLAGAPLQAPSPSPLNLIAAPLNYHAHIDEMRQSKHTGRAFVPGSAQDLGFFLKSVSSICGVAGEIELPDLPGRQFHHEAELGVIVGRETRAVSQSHALEAVFGYTCLLDITLRNSTTITNERVMRKSFETFTPIGPYVVTRAELPSADDLSIELDVNGDIRQTARTSQLIVGVAELVSACSRVMTLYPGDVIATGTPSGVGPIVPGDEVRMQIEGIGTMSKKVVRRAW